MGLLQVVVNNAASKVDCLPHSGRAVTESQALPDQGASGDTPSETPDTPNETPTSKHDSSQQLDKGAGSEVSSSAEKRAVKPHDIFLLLPESDLCNLCSLLAHEG